MNNALFVIAPYRFEGMWVFDDPSAGLVREPFVSGVPEMIEHVVRDNPRCRQWLSPDVFDPALSRL